MSVFFTADLHLNHKAIIDHCHRPFASVEEMDATLIDNINSVVTRGDLLYIVGDFSLGNRAVVEAQRKRINCAQVFLIRGNHDSLSAKQYEECGFIFKGDLCEVKVEGQKISLCHYAMRRWPSSHHGAWHLYGHSHGHLPDTGQDFSFDVGVDCFKFAPISFERVKEIMAARANALAWPNHDDLPE